MRHFIDEPLKTVLVRSLLVVFFFVSHIEQIIVKIFSCVSSSKYAQQRLSKTNTLAWLAGKSVPVSVVGLLAPSQRYSTIEGEEACRL
jgi:hypothetical protein